MQQILLNFILILTGIVIFLFYHHTLSPSIAGGDSGEIVAEGCHLGTAHPPGYPLMTVLVYFLSKLKVYGHTVAYWVNLSSAFYTSLASLLIGLIVTEYSLNEVAGSITAMLFFAFSPLIWQYAVTAEVFPLNTFFAALLLYLTVKFSKTQSLNIAIFGAFLSGLAICNQHTIILYEAPLILWMLFLLRKQLYYKSVMLLYLSIAFIVGLLPYLYLPIASIVSPKPGSWGDVKSMAGFLHHFLRKDYGTFQLFSGKTGKQNENLWERNEAFWKDFSQNQILFPFAYLLFLGIFVSIFIALRYDSSYHSRVEPVPIGLLATNKSKKQAAVILEKAKKGSNNKKGNKNQQSANSPSSTSTDQLPSNTEELALISDAECKWTPFFLVVTQIVYFTVFHSLSNLPLTDRLLYGVHQRFWMQPSILCCIWIGIGVNSILIVFKSLLPPSLSIKTVINVFLSLSFLAIAIYFGVQQYQQNVKLADQSDAWYFHQYAKAVLSPLPQNSILLINYDQQWTSVRYLQICENYRPDITAIQLSMMSYKWFQTKRSLYQHVPIFLDSPHTNETTTTTTTTTTRSIEFPGTYLTYYNSPSIHAEGAFHLISFLQKNLEKWNYQIYLGGKLGHFDIELSNYYELIPIGLVSQFYPQALLSATTTAAAAAAASSSSSNSPTQYAGKITNSWEIVQNQLRDFFPSPEKYPEETWEWTINRDYKDRLIDSASYFLATAINIASTNPQPLVDAVYYVETSYYLEGHEAAPTSLLKNLGLGHVHLVQNKVLPDAISPTKDIFHSLDKIGWPATNADGRWKEWSANRFTYYWGEFLQRNDASLDPQYNTIKQLYETVTSAAQRMREQPGSSTPPPTGEANPSTSSTSSKGKKNKKKSKSTKIEL